MMSEVVIDLGDTIGKPSVSVEGSIGSGPKVPIVAQADTLHPSAEQCTAG
jgi:hypothetical protein